MQEAQRPDKAKAELVAYKIHHLCSKLADRKNAPSDKLFEDYSQRQTELLENEADLLETQTERTIDLFRLAQVSPKVQDFYAALPTKALLSGYDDIIDELEVLKGKSPEERYEEYDKRRHNSPLSYMMHAIDTTVLAIVSNPDEQQTIIVSKPTVTPDLKDGKDMILTNARKNITTLLGLDSGFLEQFGVKGELNVEEQPQVGYIPKRINIPYLTLTVTNSS